MKQSFRKLCLLLVTVCVLLGALAVGTFTAEAADSGVEFLYQQLTLGDDLVMNFEVAIADTVAGKATVELTVDDAVTSYTVSQMSANDRGNYIFSVEVAAAQMTKNIHVAVIVDGSAVAQKDYTVLAYAQTLLNGSYGAEVEDLVKKMLYFGAKAQTYFQYNLDAPADADVEDITLAQVPSALACTVTGTVPGITYAGNSMVFTGRMTLRYYFEVTGSIGSYTFKANGNTCKATAKNGMYYVDVTGINPQNIDQEVVMTVSDGSNSLSVDYNPMHYITRMYNKDSSTTALKDLLQALYSYHLAAKTYTTAITDSLSVSEAIAQKGTGTAAYINGYVAGWSVSGTRKAIVLQDTASSACIEFWGSDSSTYNDIWATYNVGDHVTVYTPKIVDNKGLPRAEKTVVPVMVNGSYIMSSGNTIRETEISNLTTFLEEAYTGGNTLGVYTCTVTVLNENYLHRIETETGTLSIQLKDSAVTPTLNVGSTYNMKFVLTGYSNALSTNGDQYVRVSVMDAADVTEGESITNLSVSEAIKLKGTSTPAYINGYVAGWSGVSPRKAIILQDTETGECIEFWGNDSSTYNEIWSSYTVGDHVTIYTPKIVDNKGLPRADATVQPVMINGTYKLSTGNTIQVTKISNMTTFLESVYSAGKNTLGVYSCTVTVLNENYLHRIETETGTLSIQLKDSAVTPALDVGKTYNMTFVLTGYSNALSTNGDRYVRVSVMDAADVTEGESITNLSVSEAIKLKGTSTPAYINGYVAGWSYEGNRKAVVLQDTTTGECIEFWAANSSAYNTVWNSYEVGDHVTIYTPKIVDNKGLPRADATVQPVMINGTYKLSTENDIQVTEISNLTTFLEDVYSDGGNTLGAYSCTVTVLNEEYLHRIETGTGTLSIQLYQSAVTPTLEVGSTYTMQFVLTGYSNTLSASGNVYVRVSVMDAADVAEDTSKRLVSVSEAIALQGTSTAAYINGYVAGWSIDGTTRKAMILQDTTTGECIEFWADNASSYAEVWNSYAVGDYVVIHADAIVDNKGLPRAGSGTDTVVPVTINGSYKISTENDIQETRITDMDAFLNSTYTGKNVLGVYTCTVKVANANYFYQITPSTGNNLRIQLKNSVVTPELTVGDWYTMKFVVTGYSNTLSTSGNVYVRVSVMEAADVANVGMSVSEAIKLQGEGTAAQIHGYVAGWSVDGTTRKAIVLQDTETGECIEFWGSDSSDYNSTWKKYAVGDHVSVSATSIVSNKGLPRANKTVTPVEINGSYIISSGNDIQVTGISDLTAFLESVYNDGDNTLGAYSCKVTVSDSDYLHRINTDTGTLSIQLYQSVADTTLDLGRTYQIQFVLTGYDKTLTTPGDRYVRVSIMDAADVTQDESLTFLSVSEAIEKVGDDTDAYIHGYVAGWSIKNDVRRAIILQDTESTDCIEFWGNDSSAYNSTWNTYKVGDHVAIHADSIIDYRGLPRADKTVTPIQVNGADKLSTGNEIQVTQITNMNTFLIEAYEGERNALGVYSCNMIKANEDDLYDFESGTGHLRVRLYESVANPELAVGTSYAMQFVVTGFSKEMKTEGDVIIRLSLMDASNAVPKAQADVALGVMSFNMKYEDPSGTTETTHTWANRKAGVAQCIKSYLPDVVGTQELRGWQYEELMNLLGSTWAGVGLARNGGDSERCSIIYNTSTVTYLSGETIWLSETPSVQGSSSWDSAQPRILTYGKFQHIDTGTQFYVFNTHLDHQSTTARANQLAMIVEYMNKYVGSYPVILTGDFNMYISADEFSALTDLPDVYGHTFAPFLNDFGTNMKTTHGFNGGTSGSPIDFVFYSKESIAVESTKIIRDMYQDTYYLSDHYPVYSKLTLNPIHTSE